MVCLCGFGFPLATQKGEKSELWVDVGDWLCISSQPESLYSNIIMLHLRNTMPQYSQQSCIIAQAMQWDLLRSFVAVARFGSLSAAGKHLGLSPSTVSRQMSRLEEQSLSPLFLRETPIVLTERGQALLEAIAPMVESAVVAQAALEDQTEIQGLVTMTTVGELLRWVLVKALPSFYEAYPQLRLQILADNQVNSLAAGDADVALRFLRPVRGDLVSQKMYTASYALYASSTLELSAETPWLGLTGTLAQIPKQQLAEKIFASRPPRLLVEDIEALGLAVEAGLGVAILPQQFTGQLQGVIQVSASQVGVTDSEPIPSQDLWMVVHRSKQKLPKIRALIAWLDTVFAR